MHPLKEASHLIRLAVVLAIGIVAFAGLRQMVVPKDFGQYGHFRGGALEEIRALPVNYAGRNACGECHPDIVDTRKAGKHRAISCEACHGPQSKHVADPALKPQLPDVVALCSRCHEANSARPKGFPQVKTKEHSGGEVCKSCHLPHQPKVG